MQLIAAIRDGDLVTLQELLSDPANEGYTYTFMGGATPLHWYRTQSLQHSINQLLLFSPQLTKMSRAAQEGQQDALRLFLERKTNPVDTKDATGSTALHW